MGQTPSSSSKPGRSKRTTTTTTQTPTTPDINSMTSVQVTIPDEKGDQTIDMMEDFILQYTSNTPSQIPTDIERQASKTSLQSHSSVQWQESDIIVPTSVYEQEASAYSADGSEKLVVSPDALLPGDPGVSTIQNDMIDSRELMSELQKSVDALQKSMNVVAQQEAFLTKMVDSDSGKSVLQCQQTVVSDIKKTMSHLQKKLNDLKQRLSAVEKRVETKH